MLFSKLTVEIDGATVNYLPYDRGAQGAFVYRKAQGKLVGAPRLVVHTTNNDASSDKLTVQLNLTRMCESAEACGEDVILGTDIVKTEMRFRSSTSQQDRIDAINEQVALLQELREVIESRDTIYS